MALTDIEAVRLKTGDKSLITREGSRGDGVTQAFKLSHGSILTTPAAQVWIDGTLKADGVDYTIDEAYGVVAFTTAPAEDVEITFQYYWAVFTDTEVQHFLTEAGDNVTFASSKLLYALAADAAKVAMRETLAGGGAFGSTTRDTSLTAQELRETARALKQMYDEEEGGSTFPVQEVTEVAWTEHSYNSLLNQETIREL
jgi:hypothetical protein